MKRRRELLTEPVSTEQQKSIGSRAVFSYLTVRVRVAHVTRIGHGEIKGVKIGTEKSGDWKWKETGKVGNGRSGKERDKRIVLV
jgi:hypothetical protein